MMLLKSRERLSHSQGASLVVLCQPSTAAISVVTRAHPAHWQRHHVVAVFFSVLKVGCQVPTELRAVSDGVEGDVNRFEPHLSVVMHVRKLFALIFYLCTSTFFGASRQRPLETAC